KWTSLANPCEHTMSRHARRRLQLSFRFPLPRFFTSMNAAPCILRPRRGTRMRVSVHERATCDRRRTHCTGVRMTFYRRNAFNIIAALALTLACLPSQAQAQDHDAPIFSGHSVTSPLQARAATRPLLAHIVEQDSARQVQVVRADTQQVAIDAERLSINLSPGSPLSVEKLKAYRNDDG